MRFKHYFIHFTKICCICCKYCTQVSKPKLERCQLY